MFLGIGQATAVSFAREGCKKIVITDQSTEGLKATEKLMREATSSEGVEIVQKRTNVLDENEVYDLIDAAVAVFDRIDYCANCAGVCSSLMDEEHGLI